jgi:hypothetical protein
MFLIILIRAVIAVAVLPSSYPYTVHSVVCPFADVRFTVSPVILSDAVELVVPELTSILRSIFPSERTTPSLLTKQKIANIFVLSLDCLGPLSVAEVKLVVALVLRAVRAFFYYVTMCFAIFPIPFKRMAIGVQEYSLPIRQIPVPVAPVRDFAGPNVHTEALPH